MIEAHPTRIGLVAEVGTRPFAIAGRPTHPFKHNGFSVPPSSGAARDVRKVLGISRVVAIGLFSCSSRDIMKALRRFEESAIV